MNYQSEYGFIRPALLMVGLVILLTVFSVNIIGQDAKPKGANAFSRTAVAQQPLYTEYKGVRLGMLEQEVHAKLSQAVKIDESDFYVFSENETAQIAYDQAHKVIAISVDYLGGVGAPDYKMVVGNDIDVRPDGSMYKIIHYDQLGFWVSYNRTGNNAPVTTVSITIQKMMY